MADKDDKFVVMRAKLKCSLGEKETELIMPKDHGIFLRKKPQMNVKDCKPYANIQPFGTCKKGSQCMQPCPTTLSLGAAGSQPSSLQAATAPGGGEPCTVKITMDEWEKGHDDTFVDDEKALLGRCTIQCTCGGTITIEDVGQV